MLKDSERKDFGVDIVFSPKFLALTPKPGTQHARSLHNELSDTICSVWSGGRFLFAALSVAFCTGSSHGQDPRRSFSSMSVKRFTGQQPASVEDKHTP